MYGAVDGCESMWAGGWFGIKTLDGGLVPGDFPCSKLQRGDPRTALPHSSLGSTTVYPPRSALTRMSWLMSCMPM